LRRPNYTFVEGDSIGEAKANCRICEETEGRIERLVPRYVDGILDDKFKICGYCGEIYPMYDIKLITEYEPKATLTNYDNPFASGTQVEMANKMRNTREKIPIRDFDNLPVDIPKLAGKEDDLLVQKLKEGAIIKSISDQMNDEEA